MRVQLEERQKKPSELLRELLRGALYKQITPELLYVLSIQLSRLCGKGFSVQAGHLSGSATVVSPEDASPIVLEALESAMAPSEPAVLRWRCAECGRAAAEPPDPLRSGPRTGRTYCQGDSRQGAHRGHKPGGGPQMTLTYLLDDRDLLGSLAQVLSEEPVEIMGGWWHEQAKRAAAGDPEARQGLLEAYPWAAPFDPWQLSHELAEENMQLRAVLRHVMYVVTDPASGFDRADFIGARSEGSFSTGIDGLNEAHRLLKHLGEHDSSVANQEDAWLPPAQ